VRLVPTLKFRYAPAVPQYVGFLVVSMYAKCCGGSYLIVGVPAREIPAVCCPLPGGRARIGPCQQIRNGLSSFFASFETEASL